LGLVYIGRKVKMNNISIPEWIDISTHVPHKSFKAMCTRCQSSYIGKLKECNEWADNHVDICEGAKCEKCGHVYDRCLWDKCPECGQQVNNTNRYQIEDI
jgi:hypothetical protein